MFYRARNAIGLSLILVVLILGTACVSGNTTSATPRATSPTFQTSGGSFISTLQGQNSTNLGDNQGQESSLLDFDSQNTSEINIDVSDFTELVQSFSFAINRQKHFVRVISADSGDSIQAAGDLKATVTVEVLDAQAVPVFNRDANDLSSLTPTSFAVVYNDNLIQVFDVGDDGTRPRAEIAVINLDNPPDASGFRRAAKQVAISGAVVTLNVEALDNARGADTETIEQEGGLNVFGASGEDKQQKVIDLVGKTQSGRVNFNVRIRGSEDGCPEPCKVASLSPNNESNEPPPENPPEPEKADPDPNDGNAPEASEGPQEAPLPSDPSDGQSNSGNSNSPENSANNQESPPSSVPTAVPTVNPDEPAGGFTTTASGGTLDPSLKNIDVVLLIDNSSSVTLRDPKNDRFDAAQVFINSSVSGDSIGISHYAFEVISYDLVPLQQTGSIKHFSEKRLVDQIVNTGQRARQTGSKFKQALDEACERLGREGDHTRRAAIMLTNDADTSFILFAQAAQDCFVANGVPIYLYGIGELDSAYLESIAERTGGSFQKVIDPLRLPCEVQGARSLIVGGNGSDCTNNGNILSRESKVINVDVPAGQIKATFSVSWTEGEEVFMKLQPSPRTAYVPHSFLPNGATFDEGPTFKSFSMNLPRAGNWTITLTKPNSSGEFTNTDYVFGYSFIPITP